MIIIQSEGELFGFLRYRQLGYENRQNASSRHVPPLRYTFIPADAVLSARDELTDVGVRGQQVPARLRRRA